MPEALRNRPESGAALRRGTAGGGGAGPLIRPFKIKPLPCFLLGAPRSHVTTLLPIAGSRAPFRKSFQKFDLVFLFSFRQAGTW